MMKNTIYILKKISCAFLILNLFSCVSSFNVNESLNLAKYLDNKGFAFINLNDFPKSRSEFLNAARSKNKNLGLFFSKVNYIYSSFDDSGNKETALLFTSLSRGMLKIAVNKVNWESVDLGLGYDFYKMNDKFYIGYLYSGILLLSNDLDELSNFISRYKNKKENIKINYNYMDGQFMFLDLEDTSLNSNIMKTFTSGFGDFSLNADFKFDLAYTNAPFKLNGKNDSNEVLRFTIADDKTLRVFERVLKAVFKTLSPSSSLEMQDNKIIIKNVKLLTEYNKIFDFINVGF